MMFLQVSKKLSVPFLLTIISFSSISSAYGEIRLEKPREDKPWFNLRFLENTKKILIETPIIDKEQQLTIDFKNKPNKKRLRYNFDDSSLEEKTIQINLEFSF
jgi:hypothetical protein